jgi:hypothetical protein
MKIDVMSAKKKKKEDISEFHKIVFIIQTVARRGIVRIWIRFQITCWHTITAEREQRYAANIRC